MSLHATSGDLRTYAALAAFPALLVVAHYFAGANSTLGALLLTCALAASLAIAAMAAPNAREALRLRPLLPFALPFLAVLLAAGWTLVATTSRSNPLLAGMLTPRPLSIDRSATMLEAIKLAGLGCAFLVGCIHGAGRRRAVATVHILVALGVIYTFVGFADYLSGSQARAGTRFTAGLMSANSTATLLGMSLVIATALAIRQGVAGRGDRAQGPDARRTRRMLVLIATVGVLGFGLLLTQSRMGFAATAAALLFVVGRSVIALKGRLALGSMTKGATALVVAAGLFLGGSIMMVRLVKVDADAANRAAIFASHWRAFLASPDFGYGLGSFTTVNNLLMTPETFGALRSIRAAHNVYIQWLEEAGVIGAAAMFICITLILRAALLGGKGVGLRDRTVLYGLIGADIVVLLHGTTDYALQVPSIAAAWAFMLGLQFAFSQQAASPDRPST